MDGDAAGGEKKDTADVAALPIGRRIPDAELPNELQNLAG
jgi:hypothetical protein